MNYYEHHIGDYDKNTSHLTACEDGIYSRMIRRYYLKERALDPDVSEIKRLVRARTREEKSAVDSMLREFFHLEEDGWHHDHCDEVIAAYLAGEPEREVKKANEDNRLKRHREERAALFRQLTDAGQHAPWNIGMAELREMVKRIDTRPETENKPLPATAPATPATATQSPIPNTQYPVNKTEESSRNSNVVGANENRDKTIPDGNNPKRNVEIAVLLRAKGVKPFSFAHPQALEWAANPDVTDDILIAAMVQARDYKPTGDISPNYLKPIIEQLINPPEPRPQKPQEDGWWKSKAGIERKGRELGMFARGTEDHDSFKDRIFAEIRKREGKAA